VKDTQKVTLWFSAATVLTLLVAVLAWVQYQQSETAYAQRTLAIEASQAATALLSSLKDAETGQRGYLLTGDETFLEPYRLALDEVPRQLLQLRQLVTREPVPYPRMDVLPRMVDAKMTEMRQVLTMARQGDGRGAVLRVKGGAGKQAMNDLRVEVTQLLAHEFDLLEQREVLRTSSRNQLLAWMVLLSALGVMASASAALMVKHQAQRRIEAQGRVNDLELQKNAALERLATQLREDDLQTQKQYRESMETRERMVFAEKMSSVGTMVGGVAHEINNPLMGLLSYVEYARDKATDAKSVEVLDSALHEVNRIKKIVQNMLVFVRSDSAAAGACNVALVAQQALSLFAGELKKHDIAIEISLPDDLPLAHCDSGGLQQVLLNLLLNARDAVADRANKRIGIRAEQDDAGIRLHVSDNGHGIAPEVRDKLFTPFFTTKPVGKGTGLGLAVSRQLMEHMDGTVTLDDNAPEGASFCIAMKVANSLDGDKKDDTRNSGN
jgi:C4-dicarboxylate-specific signal transduction histidine kinase